MAKSTHTLHTEASLPYLSQAIKIVPGKSLTLTEGIKGQAVIYNGNGIVFHVDEYLAPCTITSFDDHFDVVPLAGQVDADIIDV